MRTKTIDSPSRPSLVYIDERYKEKTANVLLESGEAISIDTTVHKGKLVIAE